jgi:hypothetical protein
MPLNPSEGETPQEENPGNPSTEVFETDLREKKY